MATQNRFLTLFTLAVALGIAICWIDSQPNWDDTGITAGMVLIAAAAFGFALPKRAWAFALAVGIWIPLVGIVQAQNYGSILAIVIAFVGAYIGVGLRKLVGYLA